MKRLHLSLLVLYLSSTSALGQLQINGSVQNEAGDVLAFSNILLLSANNEFIKGEVADLNGAFTVNQLEPKEYILIISALGYTELKRIIHLENNLNLGIISLSTNALSLEEVTVTAAKVAFERKADRTLVNVSSLPTAAGGHALDLLSKSPSVQIDQLNGEIMMFGRNDVVVFINGQRSRLSGNELMQYLVSIPSANIETLELINHPPASYDADGTGGVINIQLKKQIEEGINGGLNLFTGYGQRGKFGLSGNINLNTGDLNMYADASFAADYTNQDSELSSAIGFNNRILRTEQVGSRPAYIGNYGAKLGLNYAIKSNSSIDVFASWSQRQWELDAQTITNYNGSQGEVDTDRLYADESNITNQFNVSTRFQQTFNNDASLILFYDYLKFSNMNPTDYRLTTFNRVGLSLEQSTFETRKETPFQFHVASLDYNDHILKDMQLSAGIKASLSDVENTTALNRSIDEGNTNDLFTDDIRMKEMIYAAYLSIDRLVEGVYSIKGGVRYEYSDLALDALRDQVNRTISRFFPSLSLTRIYSDTRQLTFSYRERISRPSFQILAPALFFLNPNTALTGNIRALPNINRTLELSLNNRSTFISVSYSHDSQPVAVVIPKLDEDEQILLLRADNIENRKQFGLNISFPLTHTKNWNSRYNFGGYWREDRMQFEGAYFTESHPFYTLDMAHELFLPKQWNLELTAKYNSQLYTGTIKRSDQLSINLGLQKKLRSATLGLSWTDIFNTGSFFEVLNELPKQQVNYMWNYDLEGSIVRLSYTYTFGNGKSKKTRDSGATDILNRVQ